MKPDRYPAPEKLGTVTSLWWLMIGVLALWVTHQECCGGVARAADWSPPEEVTTVKLAEVADCMVQGLGPYYERERDGYYRPDRMMTIAEATMESLRAQAWPQGHTAADYTGVMLAILYQQSKFRHDAVSRFNRTSTPARRLQSRDNRNKKTGKRIWIGNCRRNAVEHPGDPCVTKRWVWNHPRDPLVADLDLGIFQNHGGLVRRTHPGLSLADLRRPKVSIRVGAEWIAERARDCDRWARRAKRLRCRKPDSITCKCILTRRALGGYSWAQTTRSLLRNYAPLTRRCFDQIFAVPDGEGV